MAGFPRCSPLHELYPGEHEHGVVARTRPAGGRDLLVRRAARLRRIIHRTAHLYHGSALWIDRSNPR